MSNYNRVKHLKRVHENRKAATAERIDHAINRLVTLQQAINFNSVSKEAGVAKATLYSNEEYRSRIEALRISSNNRGMIQSSKSTSHTASKDALIDSLKRKNRKLELENSRLRNDLKIAYGQIYQKDVR